MKNPEFEKLSWPEKQAILDKQRAEGVAWAKGLPPKTPEEMEAIRARERAASLALAMSRPPLTPEQIKAMDERHAKPEPPKK